MTLAKPGHDSHSPDGNGQSDLSPRRPIGQGSCKTKDGAGQRSPSPVAHGPEALALRHQHPELTQALLTALEAMARGHGASDAAPGIAAAALAGTRAYHLEKALSPTVAFVVGHSLERARRGAA